MQKQSSDFVVIKLPSRETLIQELKLKMDQMMNDFDEIEEAILFGSLARGDYGIGSDADILIILDSSPYERYFDRIPKYARIFSRFAIPVEVFPYTRAEVTEMLKDENLFMKSIFNEGILLVKKIVVGWVEK